MPPHDGRRSCLFRHEQRSTRSSTCYSSRAPRQRVRLAKSFQRICESCQEVHESKRKMLPSTGASLRQLSLNGAVGARRERPFPRSVVKQITWPGGQMPCFTTFHAAGSKQVVARLPSALRGSCSALWQSFGCRKLLQAAGMADGRSLAAGQRAGRPTAAAGKGAVPSLEDPTARPPFFGAAPRALYLEDNTSEYRSQMRSTSFDSWRRGIPV